MDRAVPLKTRELYMFEEQTFGCLKSQYEQRLVIQVDKNTFHLRTESSSKDCDYQKGLISIWEQVC